MKELIKSRIDALKAESDSMIRLMVDFHARTDYVACENCDREAMENRHGIPKVRRKLWELQRRITLLEGCLVQECDEGILDYLELMDGAAMQALEKGLPEKATHMDFLEFLGRGFDCDECRNTIQRLKIKRDFKTVTTTLRAKREAREKAQKEA